MPQAPNPLGLIKSWVRLGLFPKWFAVHHHASVSPSGGLVLMRPHVAKSIIYWACVIDRAAAAFIRFQESSMKRDDPLLQCQTRLSPQQRTWDINKDARWHLTDMFILTAYLILDLFFCKIQYHWCETKLWLKYHIIFRKDLGQSS